MQSTAVFIDKYSIWKALLFYSKFVHFIKGVALPQYKIMMPDIIEFKLLWNVFDEMSRNLSQVDVLLPSIFYDYKDCIG